MNIETKKTHYNNLLSNYNFITQQIENNFRTENNLIEIEKLKLQKIKTEQQLKDFKFNNEVVK